MLPAPVPRGRAAGRSLLRAVHRRQAQFRRKSGHRARERARDRTHGIHRRAAGVGEILLGGADRDRGGDAAGALGLRPSDWGRLPRGGASDRRQTGEHAAEARLAARPRVRARQCAPPDRHRPLPFPRHGRGPDIARPGALVPRARRAHARGLGPDRERRRGHAHAGHPDQTGQHRRRRRVQRSARFARRRTADPRRERVHGLSQPAGEDGRDT